MEYAGLITISSGLFNPMDFSDMEIFKSLKGLSEEAQKVDLMKDVLEFTVAHEVAHQWWHGLVGSDAKRHPFIDESLTNYSTILYFEEMYGKTEAKKQEYMQLELVYQIYRISGGKDMAVDQAADQFSDSMQYGSIVYAKGPLFYRALRKKMGDQAFFKMLRSYYENNRFGFSTPDTLTTAIRSGADDSSSKITSSQSSTLVKRWIHETKGDADIGILQIDRFAESILGPDIFEGEDGPTARLILRMLGPIALSLE